jgi:SAM-dependent methyltransferase
MPTVQELYELWADDAELREDLQRSLAPRGTDSLFDAFATLRPQPGQVVLDAGARDARHAIRLVQQHGLRAVALDAVPLHAEHARKLVADAGLEESVEVVVAPIEELPLPDQSVDWIWCRDVLSHVDAARGLAEFARVLRPGGAILAYVTVATARLEPREEAELTSVAALAPDGFRAERLESAAESAGLVLRSADLVCSEWRERMIEDGTWDPRDDLLQVARLQRRRDELATLHGDAAVDAAYGGLVWGVYQLLGKLCPTIYVWERRA